MLPPSLTLAFLAFLTGLEVETSEESSSETRLFRVWGTKKAGVGGAGTLCEAKVEGLTIFQADVEGARFSLSTACVVEVVPSLAGDL